MNTQLDITSRSTIMNEQTYFLENVQRLQNEYYQSSPKNVIFKKHQKTECAQQISNTISVNQLHSKTIFIVPNTNSIWVDYTIFKLYANPQNYRDIIKYLIDNITHIIGIYGTFNIHINLNTFSISSAERYRESINLFCGECMRMELRFTDCLVGMYIYNTPSVMDSISMFFAPLMPTEVKNKVIMYGKKESPGLIDILMKQ